MVSKGQRVYIYHLDSTKVDTFSVRKVKAAKFSENFRFQSSGQCEVFTKEKFLLCPYEMYSHFKLLAETFSYLVR